MSEDKEQGFEEIEVKNPAEKEVEAKVEVKDDDDFSTKEQKSRAEKRIRQLNAQKKQAEEWAEQATRKAQEAEARAAALESRFQQASQYVTQSQLDQARAFKENLNGNIQLAEKTLATAMENGNAQEVARATAYIAKANSELARIEAWENSQPKVQPQQRREETYAPQQVQQAQPQIPRPPKAAQDFVERNEEWFGKDDILTNTAILLDNKLAQEGYNRDEEDFYEELQNRLREAFPHKFSSRQGASNSVTVAGPARPGQSSKVRVSSEESSLFKRLGAPLEAAAYYKQAPVDKNGYTTIQVGGKR